MQVAGRRGEVAPIMAPSFNLSEEYKSAFSTGSSRAGRRYERSGGISAGSCLQLSPFPRSYVFLASASIVGAFAPIHSEVSAASLPELVPAGMSSRGWSVRGLDQGIAQLDAAARGRRGVHIGLGFGVWTR